ncbi:docking domain of Afi1 for Arf3 in vesicle trafficking-domain-containing protein [Cantharellus anzutake]|uniref:docking domain of Afi1 for Arf3 in vesicle trafficking-domain-containing protein n=1 Tax=Cantharellus anzutake TaxID=1750568 RepID=UPI0019080657|nr:docking domain of Afi1 for Arf3 in vesicle trafficking-domain-containing protein [Cantharellus anzutake]KAF8343108.1 docking domain of Afi1 for Arf3 in vesicle trafficking-domain-containing protein [Cantharellus anzutake]
MASKAQPYPSPSNVSFVLLAEFDIHKGSIIRHQYPYPTGTNETYLAELMIPDGAHAYVQDWTVFFLNQTPGNTIDPPISDDHTLSAHESGNNAPTDVQNNLLYVLNLVQTVKDPAAPRGGWVKALAIVTRHYTIQIFQHVLVLALQKYFQNPSIEVLADLYDAIEAMDLGMMPALSRNEKLILRASDRQDTFLEKFHSPRKYSQESDGKIAPDTFYIPEDDDMPSAKGASGVNEAPGLYSDSAVRVPSPAPSASSSSSGSSSLLDNEPWTRRDEGDDTEVPLSQKPSELEEEDATVSQPPAEDQRTFLNEDPSTSLPFDQRSRSSKATRSTRHRRNGSWGAAATTASSESDHRSPPKNLDTHFYPALLSLDGIDLPLKIPIFTFPGEVGTTLCKILSSPTASISGPLHPHLHSNGALTHPIILLFNALITHKRVIFLGHGKPASDVAAHVLSACALASGSGCVLRGFIQRAFPYINLTNEQVMTSVPGFIAGVTNPVFESMNCWDVFCNLETGKITVYKDIKLPVTAANLAPQPPSTVPRSGSASGDELINGIAKGDFTARPDSFDNQFIEEILASILEHYGEQMIRLKFADYVGRFVRLAARYEEEIHGSTKIGFPTISCSEGQLGSGFSLDDMKELTANAGRIEGWRRTPCYEYYKTDFKQSLDTRAIKAFDVGHQISRLRTAKTLSDTEGQLILRALATHVRTYEQATELLSWTPAQNGGLMPLALGLFHPQETIRDLTVDLLNNLSAYPIGIHFLQSLNHFHRMAYARLAAAREPLLQPSAYPSPPTSINGSNLLVPQGSISRSSSNLSSASLGAAAI